MQRYSTYLVLAAIVVLLLVGCNVERKPNAIEGDQALAILMEGPHAKPLRPLLTEALERSIQTPQTEPQFALHFAGEDSLGRWSRWANVLMVGLLDADDPVSLRVRSMLQGDVLDGVRAGEYSVFRKQDVWADKQTVVFLVAADLDHLKAWLGDNSTELFTLFDEVREQRTTKAMYSHKPQDDLSDSLFNAHGWWLDIPHDYAVLASHKQPNFVRIGRELPDRILTVAWREGDPSDVNKDTLLAWRDEIGRYFADSLHVNPVWMRESDVTIGDVPAVRVRGLWETYGILGGGPFTSYIFYDDGALFLLDAMVYAPSKEKAAFLRRMEIVLKTFRTDRPEE